MSNLSDKNFLSLIEPLVLAVANINEALEEQGVRFEDGYALYLEIIPFENLINVKFNNAFIWTSEMDKPDDGDYITMLRATLMSDFNPIRNVEL